MEKLTTAQLLRLLMNRWQNSLTPVINNLARENLVEALIMIIRTAIIMKLNHQSVFLLMEIIIITNAKITRKFRLRIKEKFQPSFPWLQQLQIEARWHLSSNNNINNLNTFHKLFLTRLHNNMDNLRNITNTIQITSHNIQEWDNNSTSLAKFHNIMIINLHKTFTRTIRWNNNLSKMEVIHTKQSHKKAAVYLSIHTFIRKKSLINRPMKPNFNKWLTTMIFLLVMTMKTKEEKEKMLAKAEETFQVLMASNIPVKRVTVATTIIILRSLLHHWNIHQVFPETNPFKLIKVKRTPLTNLE